MNDVTPMVNTSPILGAAKPRLRWDYGSANPLEKYAPDCIRLQTSAVDARRGWMLFYPGPGRFFPADNVLHLQPSFHFHPQLTGERNNQLDNSAHSCPNNPYTYSLPQLPLNQIFSIKCASRRIPILSNNLAEA